MPAPIRLRRGRRGNSIVEFALVAVFLVPLMLGTISVGTRLNRAIQTAQVCRDAGHMFVRNVDFSLTANKQLLVRLAAGLNMTVDGGDGTVVLTRVMMIGDDECAGASLSLGDCTNHGFPVITQRLVVGNTGLLTSRLGTPDAQLIQADGTIVPADYLTDISVRATNFSDVLTLLAGELAYVSEVHFEAPLWSFPGSYPNTGTYARNIF